MRSIAGRTALVTGAGRGIGTAIAERLHAEGVLVAATDRDASSSAVGERLGTWSGVLDVRDPEAFRATVARVERELGPIDVLVNNAGIMPLGPFLELPLERDRLQFDVNVMGVIHGMRAVLPGMLARGRGHVVNVASATGIAAVPNAAVYSATKHAVIGLTEAVRRELGDRGVDFTFVMPSLVDTELIAGTRRMKWPPVASPADVADGVCRALQTGAVEVYVPRFTRVARLLPALLPRRVYEAIGRALGAADVFEGIDAAARAAYEARAAR